MKRNDWLKIVRDEWESMDNLGSVRREFMDTLGLEGPLPEMMTRKERLRYNSLPAEVTIYRGCNVFDEKEVGILGMSWTLSFQVAKSFPHLARYEAPYPVVYRATM
jgi:hypothetical protein